MVVTMPMLLLLATLHTQPGFVHDDVRQLCPAPGSIAALQGAPVPCLGQAIQRTATRLHRTLETLRERLESMPGGMCVEPR
jgi:hypothetical protein